MIYDNQMNVINEDKNVLYLVYAIEIEWIFRIIYIKEMNNWLIKDSGLNGL